MEKLEKLKKEMLDSKELNNLKTQIISKIRNAIDNCVHFSDAGYEELFIKMEKYVKYKENFDEMMKLENKVIK